MATRTRDVGVGAEERLDLAALVAVDAAVDGDDGVAIAEQPADLLLQVVQRVAVLGEDDDLALAARGIAHLRVVLQELREFVPLAVLAGVRRPAWPAPPALARMTISASSSGDGLGGGGLVDDGFFEVLLLLGVEVVVVLGRSTSASVSASDCSPRCRSFSSSSRRSSRSGGA